jgi:hypothetical protein
MGTDISWDGPSLVGLFRRETNFDSLIPFIMQYKVPLTNAGVILATVENVSQTGNLGQSLPKNTFRTCSDRIMDKRGIGGGGVEV